MENLYSAEMESDVLTSMIMSEKWLSVGLMQLKSADFYMDVNVKIFNAIKEMNEKHLKVDLVTLSDYMQGMSSISDYMQGMSSILCKMVENIPILSQFNEHLRIVRTYSFRRAVDLAGKQISQVAKENMNEDEIIAETEKLVFKALEREDVLNYSTMGQATQDHVDRVNKIINGYKGIPSFIKPLDNLIGWFEHGLLWYLAASTSMGKSLLAGIIARKIAEHGIPVGFIGLEMNKRQYVARWIAELTEIDHFLVSRYPEEIGYLDVKRIDEVIAHINKLPLYIDDTPKIHIDKLISKIRNMKRQKNIQIVFIDHIGLIRYEAGYRSRNIDLTYISQELKSIAKELQIAVVGISQLSRELKERKNKRPILSDLKDSGSLEQDADGVIFLYRDEYFDKNTPKPGIIECNVAKHRDGPTGNFDLIYRGKICKIQE